MGGKHFFCAFPVKPWVLFGVLYFRLECICPSSVSRTSLSPSI